MQQASGTSEGRMVKRMFPAAPDKLDVGSALDQEHAPSHEQVRDPLLRLELIERFVHLLAQR